HERRVRQQTTALLLPRRVRHHGERHDHRDQPEQHAARPRQRPLLDRTHLGIGGLPGGRVRVLLGSHGPRHAGGPEPGLQHPVDAGRAPSTEVVMPAKFASSGEGSIAVENEAPTAAKPPSIPARGWRPTAAKTRAASGGMTTKEVSLMRLPFTPTSAIT